MPRAQKPDRRETPTGVGQVALKALSTVVVAGEGTLGNRKPLESYLSEMYNAVLAVDPGALPRVIFAMRTALITVPQIAESYVPIVARRLGDAWVEDRITFNGVTIGSARLQALLRRFDKEWDAPRDDKFARRPAYLIGVPKGAQHTLGACVLAGQLRHRGLSVHLDLELTCAELASLLTNQGFMGVLLSVSGAGHLEALRSLVACSKHQSQSTPVIIGGTILEQVDHIDRQTQADLVTSNLHEMLRYCDAAATLMDNSFVPEGRGQRVSHLDHAGRSAAE